MKYKTSNIYLASALRLFGHELVGIQHDGRDTKFIFKDTSALRRLVEAHQRGRLEVSLLRYVAVLEKTKDLITRNIDQVNI